MATLPRTAALTCPLCSAVTVEAMPLNACIYFYECPACKAVLKPKAGDCCVFCSYSDQQCPPKQEDSGSCRQRVSTRDVSRGEA